MNKAAHRIALVHATPVAIEPVVRAFASDWPEAEIHNLLDDSLSPDLQRDECITEAMTRRFRDLATYVVKAGADGILFTCSAFGPAIEAARDEVAPVPVFKPNEAMFEEALASPGRIGMVATFQPSVPSMESEFAAMARRRGSSQDLVSACVPEAMTALQAGDARCHNELVAEAAGNLRDCDRVMLAHFSTAQAMDAVSSVFAGTVLTSPGCAVRRLREAIDRQDCR